VGSGKDKMKKHNIINIFHSSFISIVVFALYYLWFVFLDRRLIFLYGHRHATPFDGINTTSRHWMAGLVASGIILVICTIINLIIKGFRHNYQLPDWKIVWKYSCLILSLPILILLIFVGKPAMPILLAIWILAVLLSSLGLALYARNFIVTDFRRSIWAFLDGLALTPILQLFPLFIDYGVRTSRPTLLVVAPIVSVTVGLFWFGTMTFLYKRFKQPYTSLTNIFLSGLVITYLLLPLLHYLNSRPGYVRYISNSPNFFAKSVWLQVVTFLLVVCVLWLVGKWRKNNTNLNPAKKLLFWLVLLTIGGHLVMGLTTGKETDIWVCKDDQWIKQGNPPYEKPFEEECGIVDKAMGM
jgi:hypothetical protein